MRIATAVVGVAMSVLCSSAAPSAAQQNRSLVTMELFVDRDGYPHDVKVIRSVSKQAAKAAVESVRKWRFDPAVKDGTPVAVKVQVQADVECSPSGNVCKIAGDDAQGERRKLPTSTVAADAVDRGSKEVIPPEVVSSTNPNFTDQDRARIKQLGSNARVVLYVVVGTKGLSTDVRLIRGVSGDLDRKVLNAVKSWKFKPGTKDGKAVPVQIDLDLDLNAF